MKKVIMILIMVLGFNVNACFDDSQCDYGQSCVKFGHNVVDGTCVAKRNFNPTPQARTGESCYSHYDCQMGYRCLKQQGQSTGVCVR